MIDTMKAVVKYGQVDGQVECRDVPVPEIGPDDVLLEVKAAGVCGSDIEMWRHNFTYQVNVPVIQGHEFCGVIAEIGRDVEEWKVGDKVISETSAHVCGGCRFCRTGDYNLCPDRLGYGYGVNGAFTRYVVVRQAILHRLPEGLSFEAAAITEPVCVAYNALIARSTIKPGETVVVIGPGPIGLNCIQIARIAGAGQVICTGAAADSRRLGIATDLGADMAINSGEEDPVLTVMEATGGLGADLVVDAAGNSQTLKQSLDMVRRLGQIVKVGWGPQPVDISLDPLLTKSVTLQGTYGHSWDTWVHVLKLIRAGKVNQQSLISDVLPIAEWERGYSLVESREAVKVILTPSD